jgi:hypothetical protein
MYSVYDYTESQHFTLHVGNFTSFSVSGYVAVTEGRELSCKKTAWPQLCSVHKTFDKSIENVSATYPASYTMSTRDFVRVKAAKA